MKKLLNIFLVLLFACTNVKTMEKKIKIVVASDIHYLSPSLYEEGPFFNDFISNSDGKVVDKMEDIMDSFVEEVIRIHPDCLVLTGDITYNGEKQSHIDLSKKLEKIKEKNIKVCILPGNHDIQNKNAAHFYQNGYELVDSVDYDEFKEIYQDFYEHFLYEYGLNYVYPLSDTNWLLAIESVTNSIDQETNQWIESILKEAKEKNIHVMCATHQNVLVHNEMFTYGYVIEGLEALFKKYDVMLNISGHMHIQDQCKKSFEEILTSPLSIYPSHYGIIDMCGNEYTYTLEHVKGYEEYEKEFFLETSRKQILKKYDDELLAETFAQLNLAYFTKEPIDLNQYQEGIDAWMEMDSSYKSYIEYIVKELGKT